jgi:hypothetical protein
MNPAGLRGAPILAPVVLLQVRALDAWLAFEAAMTGKVARAEGDIYLIDLERLLGTARHDLRSMFLERRVPTA